MLQSVHGQASAVHERVAAAAAQCDGGFLYGG